jgi:capsid portal protein
VQIKGGTKRFYKQFGDPRDYDYKTGKIISSDEANIENMATEIIYCPNYVAGTDYGMPDWASQAYNIGGCFRAERGNFRHFANNLIPAIFMLIMGGDRLGKVGINNILNAFDEAKGDDSQSKMVAAQIPSGTVATSSDGKIDQPKVLFHFLRQYQKQDATFRQYIDDCMKKLMSANRVPPILLGLSSDYNRAVAEAALEMFEKLVCRPERNQFDSLINRLILTDMGIRFHEFVSRAPNLSNSETMARVIDSLSKVGGIPQSTARELADRLLDINTPKIEEYGDDCKEMAIEKLRAALSSSSDTAIKKATREKKDDIDKVIKALLRFHDEHMVNKRESAVA